MFLNLFDSSSLAHLASWLAWILLHSLWQGLAIVAVFWGILCTVHETRSRLRYGLACAALVLMTLSPVVTGFVLQDQLRTDLWQPVRSTMTLAADHTSPRRSSETSSELAPSTNAAPSASVPLTKGPQASAVTSNVEGWSVWIPFVQRLVDRTAGWLVSLWLLGVTISITRLGVSFRAVGLLRRSGTPLTDTTTLQTFARLLRRLQLDPGIRLLESSSVIVPAVLGWLRPIVLLPLTYSSKLTVSQVEALLAHELAHIVRRDYAVNLLQRFVETVLFYHPAVWWISNTIRDEREHCCDAIAVGLVEDRQLYASSLFELARLTCPEQLAMTANGGRLTERIRRILGIPAAASTTSGPAIVMTTAFMLMLLGTAISLAQAGGDNPQDKKAAVSEAKAGNNPAPQPAQGATAPRTRASRRSPGTGNGGAEYFSIVEYPVVQTELGLSDETKTKIKDLCRQFHNDLQAALPTNAIRVRTTVRYDGGIHTSQEATREGLLVFKATVAKFRPQLKELLKPEQYTRLQQIVWQEIGSAAFVDDDLIAALNMTQEQQTKIVAINYEYFLKRQSSPNQPSGADQRNAMRQHFALQEEQNSKILGTLPKELQERFTTLKGQAIEQRLLRGTPRSFQRSLVVSGRHARMLSLLEIEAVQKDLALSADDSVRVKTLIDQYQAALTAPDRERPGADASPEQKTSFREKLKEVYKTNETTAVKFFTSVKETLTPAQLTRLQQIYWQELGMLALNDPEMIKALPVSNELQHAIKTIRQDYDQKLTKLSASELTDRQAKSDLDSEQERKIDAVLTQAQHDRLSLLYGKPFKISLEARLDRAQQFYDAPQGQSQGRLQPPDLPAGSRRVGVALRPRRPLLSLVENYAVQTDLGLSPEATEKVKVFGTEVRAAVHHTLADLPDLQQVSAEEANKVKEQIEKTDKAITEKFLPKLKEILTADQFQRLKQIRWQTEGITVLEDPEVIDTLSLSKDQQDQLSAVLAERQPQGEQQEVVGNITINTIFVYIFSSERTEQRLARLDQNQAWFKERQAKVGAILTKEQQEKFATLKGREFDIRLLRQ